MTDLFQTLAPYVPRPLLLQILRDPLCPADPIAERFPAAVLFADISGFTYLTEALAERGPEGPEELTRLLNQYFSRMIELCEAEGGAVVEFSGDALTVLFAAADEPLGYAARRALQAAVAMQATEDEFARLPTSIGAVSLAMKIGLGAGEVLTMRVGGVLNRWEFIVAGEALRQAAEAESQAGRGEIVLSAEAQVVLHPHGLCPRPLESLDWSGLQDAAAAEEVLRCYIPGAVQGWLQEGLHDWLAVLRPMSVLFAEVGGLNYEQVDVVERLHRFLRTVQEIMYRYQATLARLAVDDKGTVLMVLFGAPPFAHSDDPLRAVRCALDLRRLTTSLRSDLASFQLAVGVTTGHVFAGPVGGPTCREYTVMGDTVNLAARLMAAAGQQGILCDLATYRQTRGQLVLEGMAPIRVKGKSGMIRVYHPSDQPELGPRPLQDRAQPALVGRRAELARLEETLGAVVSGQARVLIIQGEAGIGKSRLVAEVVRLIQERGIRGLIGAGLSIESQTPYRAWRDVFFSYFDLEDIPDLPDRRERVRSLVQEMAPEQLPRLPLLNDILSLKFPDTELTASLDPALRQQSLQLLLLALLRVWARERPLVLVLEDVHWLDSLSWDLATYAARALSISASPLLLLVVTRPMDAHSLGGQQLDTLKALVETETLSLGSMLPQETVALAAAQLGLPEGALPGPVAELVRQRAAGNPFFAQELVFTLRDQGNILIEPDLSHPEANHCLVRGDLDQASQTLPDTVQGLILARIDRLPPERQLTLKVGSVIGRTFAYRTLRYTMRQHTRIAEAALRAHLETLSALDLLPMDTPEPELRYMFKHIITREVAYGTLLFAQRRQLHRTVAEWYEGEGKIGGEGEPRMSWPYLPLLVYHYHQAGDVEKERRYAKMAGEQAAAQHANAEAVVFLSRALELTAEQDREARYEILLARERVYDLQGAREAQRQDLERLESLVREMGVDAERLGQVMLRRANYALVTGDYPQVVSQAEAIIEQGKKTAADSAAFSQFWQEGLLLQARGYVFLGKACWKQGTYEQARGQLEEALSIAHTIGEEAGVDRMMRELEVGILSNLGVVSLESGHYNEAETYLLRTLSISEAIADRRGIASVYNNLGNLFHDRGEHTRAQEYQLMSLQLYQEVGDRYGEGVMLHNLGLSALTQGDYAGAKSYYEQGLRLCQEIGDRQGEDYLLGSLGMVSSYLGQYEVGRAFLERSLRLCREVGDRRGESMSLDLLSFAAHHMGDHQAALAYSRQAQEISQSPDYRMIHAYVLFNLGNVLVALGQLEEATTVFQESRGLRLEVGQPHMAIESLAGLVRVNLAQGDLPQARAQAEEILDYIDAHSLDGTMEPFLIRWTCYQVLVQAGDPRAGSVLRETRQLLQERAARISDEGMQRTFLQNVPVHRQIVEAFAKHLG